MPHARASRLMCLAILATACALASPAPAGAQDAAVTPPRLLDAPAPTWPDGEPPREVDVVVLLAVDPRGAVREATVVTSASPALDAAALAAARTLRFSPARRGETAVDARVRLAIHFSPPALPPAPPPSPTAEAPAQTDAPEPAPPPPGSEVRDRPTDRGSTYETVVTARVARPEISRQTLEREEVTRMPGTMGDPFRVIEVLPGVVPLLTGVPYYYVRGAPPADTGTFIDGVRIPALFHLGLGPSVVHPTLVDRVDFFTGGAPAHFPSYVGGVVAATSADIPRDRVRFDADIRLIDTGAMLTVPLREGHTRLSASGRYSYTAALLTALQEDAYIDYWDYQIRAEHDLSPRHDLRVMAIGAFDEVGGIERVDGRSRRVTAFAQVFHVLDVRSRHRLPGGRKLELAADIGLEQTLLGDKNDEGLSAQDVRFGPRATFTAPLGRDVDLRLGADASATISSFVSEGADELDDFLPTRELWSAGTFAEAEVRASDATTILPGLRLAAFSAEETTAGAMDPRLGVRHTLVPAVVLKGNVGLYHQPPAFLIPLPGLGTLDWERGMQRSVQLSQGVEWQLPWDLSLDAQVFFHRYENLSDINIDDAGNDDERDPGEDPDMDSAFPRLRGNAYGVELIARRALTARLFGWIAYTLSRSERVLPGVTTAEDCSGRGLVHTRPATVAAGADRTHVLNLVASYELPGGFRAGARLHVRSGRPYTIQRCWVLENGSYEAVYGPRAAERMPVFVRLDLRVDKRWRYRGWDLELYFEVMNVTFSKEVLEMAQEENGDGTMSPPSDAEDSLPLVIPTLGVRGVF